jgi:hypothetical protein
LKPWFSFRTTQTDNRGSAIILSLSFVTALFFFAIGYMNLVPSELRFSRRNQLNVKGYFVADAGVIHALSWLEATLADGEEPGEELSSYNGKVKLDEDWSFRTQIQPDPETPPRGLNPVRSYTIISTAFERGRETRKVSVQVTQQSFARYAMFMDQWPSNIVYNLGTAGVDGPLHTNDILRLHVPHQGYWAEKRDPMFLSKVTSSKVFYNRKHGSSQDGIGYYRGNYSGDIDWKRPYDSEGPIAQRYQRIVAGGRENLKSGVQREPLPKNSLDLAQAAWGTKSKKQPPDRPSGKPGVSVNEGGGIYINGRVEQMFLDVVDQNPITTIVQNNGKKVTYIVEATDSAVVLPAGMKIEGKKTKASVTVPKGSTLSLIEESKKSIKVTNGKWNKNKVKKLQANITQGLPNGVVFANHDILDISGEIKGRKTIAVEVEHSDKIFISGNLTLHRTEPGVPPETAEDSLGLVAYDVMVSKTLPRQQTSRAKPLYIYAQILAGRDNGAGGFGVEDYNRGRARGYMEIFGGIAQSRLKPWGVLNGGGMSGRVVYNPTGGHNPPPYFPSISKFKIRAYLEEAKR